MILFNPSLAPLLKKRFGFTDQRLNDMRAQYLQAVINLIVNNSFTYLENNHLNDDINQLKAIAAEVKKSETVEKLVELTTEIYKLPEKYPDLMQIITTDINDLNSSMFKDFLKYVDDETWQEFLKIGAQDLEEAAQINTEG